MADAKKLSNLVNSKKNKKEEKVEEIEAVVEEQEESSLSEKLNLTNNSFFDKYKKILIGVGAVIVIAVGAFLVYQYMKSSQEKEAMVEIFPSQKYFEIDSLNLALKGNGQYSSLSQVADDYSMSKQAKLSHYYQGVIFLKQSKFDKAIEELKQFNIKDYIVQARAYSLIGDAYTELKKFKEATDYYKKAVRYKPNKNFTPEYMMKLAFAYELLAKSNKNSGNDYEKALDVYKNLLKDYPNAEPVVNAKKYKGQVESIISSKNF